MRFRRWLFLIAVWVAPHGLEARPVKFWTPDELTGKAAVVCNGLVESVAQTGRNSTITFLGTEKFPVHIWRAHVKVLAQFKGDAPHEFDLDYPLLDPAREMGDGPMEIGLEAGHRYHFFIKPAAAGKSFVGALDGDFDDGNAAIALMPAEMDQSPALSMDEAVKIARAYVHSSKSGAKVEIVEAVPEMYFPPTGCTVKMSLKPANGIPDYAEIIVRPDRTIDHRTWIAVEPTRKAAEVTKDDIGKEVRIVTQFRSEQEAFRGIILQVSPMDIVLREDPEEDNVQKPASTHLLRDEIVSVETLL